MNDYYIFTIIRNSFKLRKVVYSIHTEFDEPPLVMSVKPYPLEAQLVLLDQTQLLPAKVGG